VLIVEDHAQTRGLLEQALRGQGYSLVLAHDLETARRRFEEGPCAAVVLDWMLPDGSGTELCRELRARHDGTPILMLTARGDVEDRVAGLDAGADDYLRKPFAVAELLARVRALVRRGPRVDAGVTTAGGVHISFADQQLTVDGREVLLTARELAILELLASRHGRPVARSEILDTLWGEDSENASSSLEVLIARLRRKLAPEGGPGPIRTHRGLGYSFRADG
jgi:DNA-binding response OmpR family regulator